MARLSRPRCVLQDEHLLQWDLGWRHFLGLGDLAWWEGPVTGLMVTAMAVPCELSWDVIPPSWVPPGWSLRAGKWPRTQVSSLGRGAVRIRPQRVS